LHREKCGDGEYSTVDPVLYIVERCGVRPLHPNPNTAKILANPACTGYNEKSIMIGIAKFIKIFIGIII